MIDLYTWTTPNGRKVSIMLEELGAEYTAHAIDIGEGDQKTPEFLAISPNNKIPAIVDQENGLTLFESGAILVYLAEKYGKFMPTGATERARSMEWLMWQMGGFGPMLGQTHAFHHFNKGRSEWGEDRFLTESKRLYGVLNTRLDGRDFIVDEYSIVDMACWPWVSRYEWQSVDLADYPNVRDWYRRILDRPAVQAGYHVPKKVGDIPAG